MVNGSFEGATRPDSTNFFSILAITTLFRRVRHHPLLKYISSQESELKDFRSKGYTAKKKT